MECSLNLTRNPKRTSKASFCTNVSGRWRRLLKTRMRNCLAKWGYGASDVEILIDSWHVDPEDPDLKDEPTNAMASNLVAMVAMG